MAGLLQPLMRGLGAVVGVLIDLFQESAREIWGDVFETYEKQIDLAIKQRDLFFFYRGTRPPADGRFDTMINGADYLVDQYRTQLGSKIPQTAFEQIYVYPVVDKKLVGAVESQAPAWRVADQAFHNAMGVVSSYNVGAALGHVHKLTALRSHGAARSMNMIDKMEQGRFELFDDAAFARKIQALNVGLTIGNTAVRGQATVVDGLQSQLGSLAASSAQQGTDLLSGLGRLASDLTSRFGTEPDIDGTTRDVTTVSQNATFQTAEKPAKFDAVAQQGVNASQTNDAIGS